MFAGPNGSGKSTIRKILPSELLGRYINPDEIEKEVKATGSLDLDHFGVKTTQGEILSFFERSSLLAKTPLSAGVAEFKLKGGRLVFGSGPMNAYFASVAADLIRRKLLEAGESFTFETVMSSPDKVDLLHTALEKGYRTYLYYVATEDPEINVSRVRNRVSLGGHDVPEDKIRTRYVRSLELLFEAIHYSSRAYIWDNSGGREDLLWIAEVTDGKQLEMKSEEMPAWFKRAVWDKIAGAAKE